MIVESVQNSPKQDDVIDAIEEAQEMGDGVEYTQIIAESPDNGELKQLNLNQGFFEIEYSTENEDTPGTFRELCEHPEHESDLSLDGVPGAYEQFVKDVETLGLVGVVMPRPVEDENAGTFSVDVEVDYKAQTFWYDMHRVTIRRPD